MPGIRVGHAIEVTTGRRQWGREAHRPAWGRGFCTNRGGSHWLDLINPGVAGSDFCLLKLAPDADWGMG